MNIKNICCSLVYFSVYIVFFVLCFSFISWYNADTIFSNDDLFNVPDIRGCLSQRYDECYLFKVNYFLFFQMPKFFHMHLNSFVPLMNFIRALLFFFISIAAADFICLKKYKNYKSAKLAAFIIFLTSLIYQGVINNHHLSNTYTLIRFLFPLLLLILVFYFVSKNIINYPESSKKYTALSFFCILLMQNNTEIFMAALCLFLLFTALYSLFKFKKLPSAVYIPSAAAAINLILYVKNGFFLFSEKSSYLVQSNNILNFLENYYSYVINKYLFILIPLLLMIIYSIYLSVRNKNSEFLFAALIVLSANMLSLFFLIKFDTGFYFQFNIMLVYSMLYLLPVFIIINEFLLNIKEENIINKFIILFILLIAAVSFFSNFYRHKTETASSIFSYKKSMQEYKKRVYRYTKIFRLYTLKDMQPKIYLNEIHHDDFGLNTEPVHNPAGECYKLLENHYYTKHIPVFVKAVSNSEENGIIYYMPILAGINEAVNIDTVYKKGICFVSKEEEEEELKKTGVMFTDDELENPVFSKLLDDDFILNNKNPDR